MANARLDVFGRPVTFTEGDAALAADSGQALQPGWSGAYGGKRNAGEVRRGGLAGSPLVVWALPGVLVGVALSMFLGLLQRGGSDDLVVETAEEASQPAVAGQRSVALAALPKRKKKPAVQWGGPAPPPGSDVKLVLVVRQDLKLSVGKTAAQCAHAAVGVYQKLRGKRDGLLAAWEESGQAKIVCKCSNMDELVALAQAADAAGLPMYRVVDAGRTEVEPGTTTVLAVGPGTVEAVNSVTGGLSLLR